MLSLVEKTDQDNIRWHRDPHELTANSILSTWLNKINTNVDNLIVDDVRVLEQALSYGIKLLRLKYSSYPNLNMKMVF